MYTHARLPIPSPSFNRHMHVHTGINMYWTVHKAWDHLFADELGPMPSLMWADCCGQFLVSREAILSRPIEFYTKLLDYGTGALPWPEELADVNYAQVCVCTERHSGLVAWIEIERSRIPPPTPFSNEMLRDGRSWSIRTGRSLEQKTAILRHSCDCAKVVNPLTTIVSFFTLTFSLFTNSIPMIWRLKWLKHIPRLYRHVLNWVISYFENDVRERLRKDVKMWKPSFRRVSIPNLAQINR